MLVQALIPLQSRPDRRPDLLECIGPQGCEARRQGVVRAVRTAAQAGGPGLKAGELSRQAEENVGYVGAGSRRPGLASRRSCRTGRSGARPGVCRGPKDSVRRCGSTIIYNIYQLNIEGSIGLPPWPASGPAKVHKMAPNPLKSFSRRLILRTAGIARAGTASGP